MHYFRKSRLIAAASLIMAGLTLSGCNGFTTPMIPPQDNLNGRSIVFSGMPLPTFFVASAAQWNEDYAVTAAHTPFVKKVAHRCSTGCDLLFIKRKAKEPVPEWRVAIPGEKVISAGSSSFYIPVYGTGKASDTRVRITNKHEPNGLRAHSAAATVGMSGGPLYGTDGSILGITVGMGKGITHTGEHGEHSIAHAPRVSLFVPYEDIKEEWEIFQRIQNGEKIPVIKRPTKALSPEEYQAAKEEAIKRMEKKELKEKKKKDRKEKRKKEKA